MLQSFLHRRSSSELILHFKHKGTSNFTLINPFFNHINELPFQLVQPQIMKLILNLFQNFVSFIWQFLNRWVKHIPDFLFERLERVRIGKNDFFDFINKTEKTHFVGSATLTFDVFADECLVETVLAETHKCGWIALGAFGEVDLLAVLILAHWS